MADEDHFHILECIFVDFTRCFGSYVGGGVIFIYLLMYGES
jgi:hypothetical protein